MAINTADIIRAGTLWGYSPLTRFLAHDPRPLLEDVGLNEGDIDDPDQFVPRPSVVALLERSALRLDCPDFGMRLGALQDVNILGALAFAIRNASKFGDAVAALTRLLHFHSPMTSASVESGDNANEVRVVFHHSGPDVQFGVQMAERDIGLFCRIDRHLTGDRYKPTRVTFTHQPVSSNHVYVEHLGLTPEFGAPVVSVSLDRREFSLRLKGSNPQLQAIVERYIELNAPNPGIDTARRVKHAIAKVMQNDHASVDDVADMLRMHPRTLQRRLTEAGTTFEKVRDEVRKEAAQTYLANTVVPLAHVAHLLGYANQSVLTRSCLRWFGKTPLAMRREITARGR